MKKGLLKMMALSIAVVLLMGLVACQNSSAPGQSQQGQTSGQSDQDSGESAANKPAETVTFNIFRTFASPEYPEDGGRGRQEILKALEKAGLKGIDFKVTSASGPDYFTKLNLLASSGESPDMFNVDMPTMTRFADEGLIMPLEQLIEQQAPHARKLMKEGDLEALKYDEHIYAYPVGYRPEPFNGPNTGGFVIRQDWLDNLSLKEPKTMDEFYNVLKAFTFKDPDKNGQNDTYGLSGDKNTTFAGIFGAYGIIPSFWHERDGKLKQGSVLPETKEVLALLQKWYKEGLIDPDFPIMERKQLEEKIINSKVGVFEGSAFDPDPKQPLGASLRKVTPSAQFTLITPPVGPTNIKGWPENAPAYGDIRAVSAKCKNPELLMKLIDWSADDSENGGFYLVTYGIEGEHYTYDREKNRIKQLVNSYSDLYRDGFSNPVRFVQVVDRRWMTDEALNAMSLTNDKSNTIENAFWKTVPAMFDYPDVTSASGSQPKLWSEYFTKIVTGTWSADKWDEYVQKYYSQGGKIIEDQVNAEWQKSKK